MQRADYRPMPQRELLHRMHVGPDQRPAMRVLIREMLGRGTLIEGPGGRLIAPGAPGSDRLRGTLQRHRDGFGFVVPEDGGDDVFVAPRNLGGARSGDRVVVRVDRRGRGGGSRREGVVVETVERRHRRVLGVLRASDRGFVVHPFDSAITESLHLPAAFARGAADGDVAQVELLRGRGDEVDCKVVDVLGKHDAPGVDVAVVMRRYGLVDETPPEVGREARALPARIGPRQAARRKRFDDPAPVTIDGETAKDFDDAIAVSELPGNRFRLYVHIADVSHFVAPGSALDREAARRGTSVYFPGRVIPMFPEKLSNDLCSLRPGVERLVQTAILDVDADGALARSRFADGVIRSAARLTYTQVSRVIEGERNVKGVPRAVIPMLQVADRLRRVLEKRRARRGSIDFDLPEPRILLDVEGVMTGITIEPRNAAHLLVEECMLLANEAVASHLEQRGEACMYRVHEAPDPDRLEVLAEFVRGFGLELPAGGEIEPALLQRLMAQVEGRPEAPVVGMVALRSMKQARYTMTNSGHFGLAAPTYCHFTSPIRRYPDLVVHRLLRRARRRAAAPEWVAGLDTVAEQSSELERNAEAAERELLNRKKVAFIRGRVGELFDGIVTGVARFGLFVQLTENLVEGLVRVESLGSEYFEFREHRQELRGVRSGARYRLGDRVRVQVVRVDTVLQRVDLELEPAGGVSARRPAASQAEGVPRARSRRRREGTRRRRETPRRRRQRGRRR
jgi:ribonuclease R